jgi:hypothetical protein
MGVAIVVAVILAVFGLGALFVAPWLGAAFRAAAVIWVFVGVLWLGGRAADGVPEREEPETPHMPGPSS